MMKRALFLLAFLLILFFAGTNTNPTEYAQNPYNYKDLPIPESMPHKLKELSKMPPPSNLDEFEELLASNTYVIGDEEHPVEFNISWAEIKLLAKESYEYKQLDEQLAAAKKATEKYKDIRVAMADGYYPLTSEVPWMGTHYVKDKLVDNLFDPEKPEGLDYVLRNGKWELVGIYYGVTTEKHPEGFSTKLDVWHVHKNICIATGLVAFTTEEKECIQNGWRWVGDLPWMLHAWIWEENPWGIFVEWNPALHPKINLKR